MLGQGAVMQGLKSEVLSHLWQEHGPRDDDDAECQRVRKMRGEMQRAFREC